VIFVIGVSVEPAGWAVATIAHGVTRPCWNRKLVSGTHADGAPVDLNLTGSLEEKDQLVDVVFEVVPDLVRRIDSWFTCEPAARPASFDCFEVDLGELHRDASRTSDAWW